MTLPAHAFEVVLRELQLTINTTYARSIGCAPYILMFGTPPPSHLHQALPDPTTTATQRYAEAVRRQVGTATKAAALAHAKYRARATKDIPPDKITAAITVGKLAMVVRPRTNKLLTANAGPFLVTRVSLPHVYLQSLTHSHVSLKENVKNVRPLQVDLT